MDAESLEPGVYQPGDPDDPDSKVERVPNDPETAAERPTRDPKPRKHRATGKKGGRAWSPEQKAKASERAKREAASRARAPARVSKSSSDELAGELAGILALPAVPAVMLAPRVEQKVFLGEHFLTSAPKTARRVVKASESSPELRSKLESLTRASVTFALISAGIGYLAPVALTLANMQPIAESIAAFDSMDPAATERLMSMIVPDGDQAQTAPPAGAEAPPDPGTPAAPGPVGPA